MSKDVVLCKVHSDADAFQGDLQARVLWNIPWNRLTDEQLLNALIFVDIVYQEHRFQEPPTAAVQHARTSPRAGPTMALDMTHRLQLEQEQRPVLALRQRMSPVQRQEQTLALRQLFAMQHKVLQMTEPELQALVAQAKTPEEQKKTLRLLVFTLAGKLKPKYPDMTWNQVRKMAWRAVTATNKKA